MPFNDKFTVYVRVVCLAANHMAMPTVTGVIPAWRGEFKQQSRAQSVLTGPSASGDKNRDGLRRR